MVWDVPKHEGVPAQAWSEHLEVLKAVVDSFLLTFSRPLGIKLTLALEL